MKLLTKIGMPALMLSAAFIVTPVMAQNDQNAPAPSSDNPAAAAPAQPSQDANSATVPAQSAQDAAAPAQPAQDAAAAQPSPDVSAAASPSPSSAGNMQVAMNTTGNAGDFSSIPNTEKKYHRATRGSDFRSEAQTTKELNEKVSSENGVSASNAQ